MRKDRYSGNGSSTISKWFVGKSVHPAQNMTCGFYQVRRARNAPGMSAAADFVHIFDSSKTFLNISAA
eukprot:368232-Rhodomonas_salina.2